MTGPKIGSFFDESPVFKLVAFALVLLTLSGCASYGVIENKPASTVDPQQVYSIKSLSGRGGSGDIALLLAFSGGGTRAAALAYGVLQELRDTTMVFEGQERRLLDEVDTISSVSGGSFTSAYYGLYGERIFTDFEDVFLRSDVQGTLMHSMFNPLEWFRSTGRTEMAVKYYEDVVFQDATFADMRRSGGPLVLINASDLGYGVRFSFVQEYFNLLCSDISSFPVARAVTASSAVPVLFNPVVVKNYPDCKQSVPAWLTQAAQEVKGDPQLTEVIDGLKSYFKKENRQYAHFVDGGITDNLGLRAIYEVIEVSGGAKAFLEKLDRKPPRHVVVISVNASTEVEPKMDKSNAQPSLKETIAAVTDIQLHRYNTATLSLMDNSVKRWAQALSTPAAPVTPHFIQVAFADLPQVEQRTYFNLIPTSLDLNHEQVDKLIAAGRELLRNNPGFRDFVKEGDR